MSGKAGGENGPHAFSLPLLPQLIGDIGLLRRPWAIEFSFESASCADLGK